MPHSKKVGSPTKNLLRGAFRELLVEKLMQLSVESALFSNELTADAPAQEIEC
jgi:hypothetical protein